MPTSTETSESGVGPTSAGATGSQPAQDPQQAAVNTPDGVEFLHAGSGNSLGSGLTAGGQANVASRDALPDTDAEDEPEGGSASGKGSKAQR